MNAEDISRIGVIGAGLMGHGIALNFALGGFDVYLNDTTDESLEKALGNIDVSLGTMKSVGLADEAGAAAVPSRIHTSTSLAETVADVDFVVEAVFEDMDSSTTSLPGSTSFHPRAPYCRATRPPSCRAS